MNMFARFNENPAKTLQDIKETQRYGRTHGRTDGQRENSIPPTIKVCGGYKYLLNHSIWRQTIYEKSASLSSMKVDLKLPLNVLLFVLMLYIPVNNFQLCRDNLLSS